MTTVDIPIGTAVYVRWYGHIVQAEVLDRSEYCKWPPFAEWIPVSMTVPSSDGKPIVDGCRNVCMFHMRHVYATADEAQQAEDDFKRQGCKPAAEAPASVPVPTTSDHFRPVPTSTTSNPSEAWQKLQQFKRDHWDAEHNHLRIDALDEFYQLWRYCVAPKYGITLNAPLVSVDLGSPDGDHTGTMIVDSETGEILPEIPPEPPTDVEEPQRIISDKLYDQLRQELKKLTRKELRSTGSITYEDGATQMSLFD